MRIELSGDLAGALGATHGGGDGEKAEAWKALDVALNMIGVAHLDTHHLITATDAQHRRPFAVGSDDGLRTTIATQLVEVVERRLGTRQDDDIGLEQVVDIIGIEEVDAGILLEGVEVGIVGEVLQHDHSHVDLTLFELPRFLGECHTIFLLDMDILEIGHNA